MTYRKICFGAVLAFSALAVSACGGSTGKGGASPSSSVIQTMQPQALRQIVAADNTKERTIMWQLKTEKDCTLEYRMKGSDRISSEKATSKSYKGNNGISDSYLYTVRLTNLTKGTDYEYRTRTGDTVSEWYPLKTDDGKSFKAVVVSDSQSSDYADWEKLFKGAMARNKDADFFVDLGDIVDNGEDEYQWQTWLKSVEPTISDIPLVPALGNHEAYTLDWKMMLPERYTSHFNVPQNGDSSLSNHYYSFDWGDVHFTVLDTSLYEEKEWIPDLYEKEKVWAKKDILQSKKKWKVVLMHKDPFQYSFADPSRPARQEGFSEEGQTFMPIFDETGVDLVLSAHLHTYRDRGHVYDFKRNPKGPAYVILGLSGNVRYPGLWKEHALDEYTAPQPETDNYVVLEASEDALILTGYLPDGSELHRTEVRKSE